MAELIRVADYIAQTLVTHGIRDVFLVTGGGAMHLNDAIGRNKGLRYFCCHHEQACAMAAESYFRLTNRLAAVNVTTGPGGTNAITGVYGAFVDSLGMVVISGQVKWETVVRSTHLPLRQLGDQELDIVKMVAPITKYAVMVTDPSDIRYHMERAIHLASSGRPGPVWIDVPVNVQGAKIDPEKLRGYDPAEDRLTFETPDLPGVCRDIAARMRAAKRPVIFAGGGIRLSGKQDDFIRLIERWGIPAVTAWNAHDLLWDDHPCYAGRPGTIGDRPGNFTVQNADFLLVLGCRLNVRQVSYAWRNFARHAFKVIVDIDATELKKPTVFPDLPVHADVADVIRELLQAPADAGEHIGWLNWCKERVRKYPVVLPSYWETAVGVNPYCFAKELFDRLPEGEIVVTGDGTACVTTFQAATIRRGQRLYTNSGCASMGYDLPAAIGAAIGSGAKRVICLAGDGSIQMNLQELQTIVGYGLPVKLFVLNNQGYHSIRQTQQNFFPGNTVGCGPDSRLSFPSFEKLAGAYGFPYSRCDSHARMSDAIARTIDGDGLRACEIMLDLNQPFAPKLSSKPLPDGRIISPSLEDMAPFLDREELASNLLIPSDDS
jgi:acetolactate synthase-1/2/3 large subunit